MKDYVIVNNLSEKVDQLGKSIDDLQNISIINSAINKDIKRQIEVIEKGLEEVRQTNFQRMSIRNIKIFGKILRFFMPFLIATSLSYGLVCLCYEDTPVINDYQVVPKHTISVIDNNSSINEEYSYQRGANTWDEIAVYGKWELKDDGKYHRTVTNYKVKVSLERMKEMINDKNAIKDNFLYSGEDSEEISDTIPEDLDNKEYIQATVKYDDRTSYITKERSDDDFIGELIAFIIGFAMLNSVSSIYRSDVSNFSYSRDVNKLKREYRKIDVNDIKRQFKEKRKEFERIKNGNKNPIDIDDIINTKTYRKV